jgi:osmotically-inducible protein OsmY
VKTQLAAAHLTTVERIRVDTDDNGVVYLSGIAKSRAESNKAESIAKKTDGVASVKNDIVVRQE